MLCHAWVVVKAHFLKAGVGRCLNDVRSGRDWIQKAMSILKLAVTVSRFFTSLKSERRLRLLGNIAAVVRSEAGETAPPPDDPFVEHAELDGFAIYAADGHFHGSSTHEELIGGKLQAVGHLLFQYVSQNYALSVQDFQYIVCG